MCYKVRFKVLISIPKEEVIYLFSDECPQSKEFAIYSMKDSLQEVSFPVNKIKDWYNLFIHSFIFVYLGSSESKSSKSWRTNFWSMTFFPIEGWKSGDSKNLRKNS